MSKRQWFRIHSFTGVITGLLLFVVCWSGTFAVLAHEFDWLVTPAMQVSPQPELASWADIEAAAVAEVPGRVGHIEAPLNRFAAAGVWLTTEDLQRVIVWVDPYDATVTGVSRSQYGIATFLLHFHREFSLSGYGIYLVTPLAITLLISALAALCFYKRWWTRFFRFNWRSRQARWSELHKLAGLWSLWFVLLMAVTGGWYLVESLRLDIGDGVVNYVGSEGYAVHTVPLTAEAPDAYRPLAELLGTARTEWPELEWRVLGYGWYSGSPDILYLAGQTGLPLLRDRANQLHLDRRTGDVLWRNSQADLPPYWVWANLAPPLHFGTFAGMASKLVWFFFGLLLCGLILSGTYLHARRLARPSGRRRHFWPGTLPALLVSLAVMVAAVPAELTVLQGYYGVSLYGTSPNESAWMPELGNGVKVAITSWVVLTVVILAGWAMMLGRSLKMGAGGIGNQGRTGNQDGAANQKVALTRHSVTDK